MMTNPLPSLANITVKRTPITDEASGTTTHVYEIDASMNGYSTGTITLDDPGDLAFLRDEIDIFLKEHNYPTKQRAAENNPISAAPEEPAQKPKFLNIIDDSLNGTYKPLDESCALDTTDHPLALTTQEIQLALADMVDMDLNEIAEAMTFLGYRVRQIDGKTGWALAPRH